MSILAVGIVGGSTASPSAPLIVHLRRLAKRAIAGRSLAALIPAPFYVLTGLLLLQVGSATAKNIIDADNVIGLVFLRNTLGAGLLWIVVRPDVTRLTRSQWLNVLGLGGVLAAFSSVFYYALNLLPLGIVMTVGFVGALAVSVVGARRPIDYLWPALALAGILLLTPLGDAGLDPFGLPHVPEFLGSRDVALSVLVIALFGALPFGLEFLALKRLSPAVFGILLSTEPAIAALVGMIMLGEFLSGVGWIALAVVSIAALGATLTARRDTLS